MFHLPDRPDGQARHPDLAESVMCHRTGRLTYPFEPFGSVWDGIVMENRPKKIILRGIL